MLKQKPIQYALLLASALLYLFMGYHVHRHETTSLFAGYFTLFALFIVIVKRLHTMNRRELQFWIAGAILLRIVLSFSIPALSDDFYRFIWDGRLVAAGYHPYAAVPSWYMDQDLSVPGLDPTLFEKLNSKETFTNYPPFAQLIFWLSTQISDGTVYRSMLSMRAIIFLFDIATLWILWKVLQLFRKEPSTVLLYALNPLVILEVTGNLHYEGMMVFFLFLAVLLLKRQQTVASPVAYAASVCTKLVTLMFLPLLVRYLGWKKSIVYWMITCCIAMAAFIPLLDAKSISGLLTSTGYYFQRFEFNASVYYLIRALGYWIFGFNIIQFAGPALAVTAALLILFIAFRKMPERPLGEVPTALFHGMMWCFFIYLLSTPILHPWYIITLLAVSLLTPYRFPLVWTALIFLSYGGYTPSGFQENPILVVIEYTGVAFYLLYEIIWSPSEELC